MTGSRSSKVEHLEESLTLALTAKVRSMRDAGINIVSFTAGEMDFPTPRHIKNAGIQAIERDFTRYTPNRGIPELIQAIVRKFSRDNGMSVNPEQILVSSGAKQSIFNALQALCNPGDEVLIPSPFWVSYPEIVKLADAVPVLVPLSFNGGFTLDAQKVKKAITDRTKAIVLNSPCNPTGAVCSRNALEQCADAVRGKNIYIISDEIYEKVIYDGNRHLSIGAFEGMQDHVITINGVSKAYAMAGWRIGYLAGPLSVVDAAAKVQGQTTSNANSIAQKAAVAALDGPENDIRAMVTELQGRRDITYRALAAIKDVDVYMPEGAMFFFFDVRNYFGRKKGTIVVRNSADIALYLLEHHHVALVPGVAFGDDGCLRMSFSCGRAELELGLDRIARGLGELS